MELKINSAIKSQTKVSYAIESAGPLPYDIDCGEGINIVMIPPEAKKAFDGLTFEMLRAYPHSVGIKDSIIDYWKDYTALNYKQIVLCDGSISGLYLINRLFLEPGDRVLGYVPQFSEYETDVKMYGCAFDGVPLKAENNYKFSPADVLAALKPEHKLIYLDNPNNPTGQVIPLAEIETILQAAQKQGTAVIVDEAYGDYMPRQNAAANLFAKYDNLIIVKTFSKGFGHGHLFNQRRQQVAQYNGIGNALRRRPKDPEDPGKQAQDDTIQVLPVFGNGPCNIVGSHKKRTQHQAAPSQVRADKRQVDAMPSEQYKEDHKSSYVTA